MIHFAILLISLLTFGGAHYEVPEADGVDHVLIYAGLDDASLRYTGAGEAVLTDYAGQELARGVTDYYMLEDETGYLLTTPDTVISFYVIDYSLHRPSIVDVETRCDATVLALDGLSLSYVTPTGAKRSIDHLASIRYTNLAWGGEEWQDSVATEPMVLTPIVSLPALYRPTTFCIVDDAFDPTARLDSICSAEVQPVAVGNHPVSITTKRGETIENEPSRPISEDALEGSAALEIQFLSNPTPNVLYYRWEIYKGSTLLATRTDRDERYTFSDYGSYQVKLWCSNDSCVTDSTLFTISISASMLRVPNVFTPNGDGQNEEFRVMYRSLSEFHCWIYNRWGHLVYEWTDPAKGWNGMIGNRPAAEGAYYYIIRARGTDAEPGTRYHRNTKRNPADVGVYQLSGHINLIR